MAAHCRTCGMQPGARVRVELSFRPGFRDERGSLRGQRQATGIRHSSWGRAWSVTVFVADM